MRSKWNRWAALRNWVSARWGGLGPWSGGAWAESAVGFDSDALVLSVKTDNAGASNNDQFTLPAVGGPYDVDYPGGALTGVSGAQTITFPAGAGTYSISITSAAPMQPCNFDDGGDKLKLLDIEQFGTVTWSSLNGAFYGCTNMTITAPDGLAAGTGAVIDFENSFRGCSGLTLFPLIDTSSGTTFLAAWLGCSGLTSFPLIDTSSAGTVLFAWFGCSGLTSFPLIDTSSVTDFQSAWQTCGGLTSFPFLDVSSGIIFSATWSGCSGLNGVDFPTLHMDNMTNGTSCFINVTLSTASWSDLLVYINANNTDLDAVFHGGNSTRNAGGTAARDALAARVPGWTITDGGP